MKRLISILLCLILVLSLAVVPAFAADTPYIPPLPPFLTVSGDKVIITDLDKIKDIFPNFFNDFYTSQYIVLLEQWKAYQDDKEWSLTFVKLNLKSSTAPIGGFDFTGGTNGIAGNTPYYIAPVRYIPSSNITYDTLTCKYEVKNKKFYNYYLQRDISSTPITFAYMVDSSPLSGTSTKYPYRNTLDKTHLFEVNYSKPMHYDWWLGVKGTETPPVENPDINIDTDGDGKPDINIDTDSDGKPDINIDTDGDKKPDINVDTNGDKKPDINIDTDGDKKPDINIDTDGDKKPDINIDTDGDKKPDINVDTNGDKKPDINIDTDGDKKPDINIDTDGDKKPDINVDTNGDKKPDINIDTDGDKKPDINVDTNGDKKPDINIDTNGDGNSDTNIDTDGDGKPDTNIKPPSGGGSSGGTGGGTSGGTGDNDWFEPEDDSLIFNKFPIFNPFDYDNYTPPKYNNPYTDYDPLKGYEDFNYMPDIPKPSVPNWNGYDPFKYPY